MKNLTQLNIKKLCFATLEAQEYAESIANWRAAWPEDDSSDSELTKMFYELWARNSYLTAEEMNLPGDIR